MLKFLIIYNYFPSKITPCDIVLYVDVSDETMKNRLMKRGESSGRVDDNEETIKKRLQTFHEVTQPVIDYYQKQGKLRRVNAERDPNAIFEDVEKVLNGEDPDKKRKEDLEKLKGKKVAKFHF